MLNGKPEFDTQTVFRMADLAFPGGRVATLNASDGDDRPFSYALRSVTGIGDNAQWWFQGNQLFTDYRHNARSGLTRVWVAVEDGQASEEQALVFTWAGGRVSS